MHYCASERAVLWTEYCFALRERSCPVAGSVYFGWRLFADFCIYIFDSKEICRLGRRAFMSTIQKYFICIGLGVVAEIAALYFFFFAPFVFSLIHIPVSENSIVAILFPYFVIADWQTVVPFWFIGMTASLFQWPIYGWICGSGWAHQRFKRDAIILAGIHIVSAVVAYHYWSEHPFRWQ